MKTTLTISVPQEMMKAIVEAGLDRFAGLVGNGKVTEVESGSGYSRSSEFKITVEVDLEVAHDTLIGQVG
jgi:hypothetical protein